MGAGIGWRGGEYEVVVVDEQGHAMVGPSTFDGRRVGELARVLLDHAARGAGALCCVVDSTNGTLDGHLMAAGRTGESMVDLLVCFRTFGP